MVNVEQAYIMVLCLKAQKVQKAQKSYVYTEKFSSNLDSVTLICTDTSTRRRLCYDYEILKKQNFYAQSRTISIVNYND